VDDARARGGAGELLYLRRAAATKQRENREEEEREFSQGPVHKFRKYRDLGVKKNLTTVLEFK
jgi:hypothetical protein